MARGPGDGVKMMTTVYSPRAKSSFLPCYIKSQTLEDDIAYKLLPDSNLPHFHLPSPNK